MGIYVDDLIILSQAMDQINSLKRTLSEQFKMVDFGEINTVLGIRVRRHKAKGLLHLGQEKYADAILRRFNMETSKGVDVPLPTGTRFQPSDGSQATEQEVVPYRAAIGCLMYLMTSTQPDLASAIQSLSKFLSNPGRDHWEGLKRVMRYLNKKKKLGLLYLKQKKIEIVGYCDSDGGECQDTRRSISGYVFMLGGAAISWSSKRQQTVALSSCEAEYMAATLAVKEALWEQNFLEELKHWTGKPMRIYSDSQSAMELMKHAKFHSRVKHIDIQLHFIREIIEAKRVEFFYVPTAAQVADALTKPVPRNKTEFCRDRMGLAEYDDIQE